MISWLKRHLYFLKEWYGMIFIYPQNRIGASKEVDYDPYWQSKRGSGGEYFGHLSHWQKQRADIIASALPHDGAISVLDLGAGSGEILHYLSTLRKLSQMVAVDGSARALEKAEGFGITAIKANVSDVASLQSLPKTDYVLMLEILEHIPNSEELLAFALSKANQGVFFSFPNSGFFTYRLRLLMGRMPMQWRTHPAEHLRFWTLKDLRWWLNAQGYTNAQIFTYEGMGLPLLHKIWPSMFAAGLVVFVPSTHFQ